MSSTESQPRLIAAKFAGQRGPQFTEWSKDYLDAATGKGDEDASWTDCFLGQDPQAGLSAAQTRRRTQRRRESYASLLQHIDDESLKAVIRAEAGPLAVNVQDRSNGRVAWQVILRECQEPASALHINTKILEYNGLTMAKDVGITEASVTDFNRLIVSKNADLPLANRFSDDSMTEKMLGAIIIPPTLAQIADTLLQCPTANRDARFYTQPVAAVGGGPAVPGGWNRRAVVQHLDELWRSAFKRGEVKFAAPTSRPTRTGPSNRADGMVAEDADAATDECYAAEYDSESFEDACAAATSQLVWNSYEGKSVDELAAFMDGLDNEVAMAVMTALEQELCCFNCFGLGHRQAECPSPKADRTQVIDRLMSLVTRMKTSGARRGPFSGLSRGGRGGRGRGNGWRGGRNAYRGGRAPFRPARPANADTSKEKGNSEIGMQAETIPGNPNMERAPGASANEIGAAAITTDEIDPLDIFGEPMHATEGADEVHGWSFPAPVKSPMRRAVIACAGFALVGVLLAVTASRRYLPSPRRLATILVVAGAQTGYALAPPTQYAPPNSARQHLGPTLATAAAIGAVAGSLLNHNFDAEPTFIFSCVDTSIMPTEFAFLGDRAASGLMPMNLKKNDGIAEMLIDSGATSHMVDNALKLSRVTATNPRGRDVRVANGHVIRSTHVGEMDVTVNARYRRKTNKIENCATVMTLTDVLVVPGLKTDLFSCNAAFECDGIRSYFNDERRLVLPDGGEVSFAEGGHRRKSLIKYHQAHGSANLAASTTAAANDMVHNLLAHFSPDRIAMARERMRSSSSSSLQNQASGMPKTSELQHASHDCLSCGLGGAHKPAISHTRPRQHARVGVFGDSVHVDLCGPYPPSVHTGFKYVIGFADRATREVHIYFLVSKTAEEVRGAIETFVSDNGRVKQFVFDNGGEFTARTVEQLLNEMMTSRRFSVPYTPQRNGLIERFWYTLNRQTRILLAHTDHTEALWPFAMSHVVAIHNSLPTRALDPPMAPSEARTGKVPSLKRFSKGVWGCDAVVNLPTPSGASKLSPTGVKANYLGVDARRSGEFFFIPALNKVVSLVNAVKYFPTEFTPIRNAPIPSQPPTVQSPMMPIRAIGNYQVAPAVPTAVNNPNLPTTMAIPINVSPDQAAMADLTSVLKQSPPIGSSIYSSSFVSDWCFAVDAEAVVSRVTDAPKNHRDIHGRPDEEEWKKAEILDFEAKMRNGAFAILDRSKIPAGTKTHKLIYAYVNKCDPITKDLIERRARLVAAGYSLRAGIEYTETACGTMRGSSVRALLCCASIDDDDIFCGDVEKAFTQAPIDHEIYLEPPPQLNLNGKVLKALMSIEGLPQSGWLFQNESFAKIRALNGRQTIDPNIWIIPVTIGSETIDIKVGIWVDDFLIIVPRGRRDLAEKFWSDYRTRFKCKDLVAEPKTFINIEISRDRKNKTITLTQSGYIDAMFDKFMHGSESKLWTKLWNTPIKDDEESLLAFSKLSPGSEEEQRKVIEQGFMSIVGSILYASAMTRPDISFHTAFLAKLMSTPSPAALDAALGIVSYLKRTRKLGITYGSDENLVLYTDSSWGNENPRPMAGYASCYGGAALSWAAKSLKIVPLSSAEAESAVFSLGCKDAMFIKQLLAEIRPKATPQIVINAFIDNTAAIDIVKSHGASGRTKHFERWITYVRDLYQRKIVLVSHLKTDEMPADIFTKPLPYLTFTKFRRVLLGM